MKKFNISFHRTKYLNAAFIIFLCMFMGVLYSCSNDTPDISMTPEGEEVPEEEDSNKKDDDIIEDNDPNVTYSICEYEIVNDEAMIKAFPEEEEIRIPRYYKTEEFSYPVTTILNGSVNSEMKIIHIPGTIKKIEDEVFYHKKIDKLYIEDLASWCQIDFNLQYYSGTTHGWLCYSNPISDFTEVYIEGEKIDGGKIIIPDGVKKITPFAFNYLKVEEVFTGNDVEEIGMNAFENCWNLSYVKFGNKLKTIGDEAFHYTKIENLVFPPTLESVGMFCFSNAKIVYIPSSLQTIGFQAFYPATEYHIDSLDSWFGIEWQYDTHDLLAFDFSPFDITYDIILNGNTIKDVILSNSMKSLETNDVTFWGFNGSSIETVDFNPETDLTRINPHTFSNCKKLQNVNLPGSIYEIDGFDYNSSLQKVTINKGTTHVRAFRWCPLLKEMILPSTLEKIDLDFLDTSRDIEKIYIHAVNPPEASIGEKEFPDAVILYVPKQSLERYKKHEVWGRFKNIETL